MVYTKQQNFNLQKLIILWKKFGLKIEVSLLPEKFVLGFCGNLFNFFHFPLSWGFLIGNAPLNSYYFDFLGPFHFFSYKLYNSLQHIIFQKKLNFFSRILIDLFS